MYGMVLVLASVTVALFIAGLVVGRWQLLIVPAVGWPLFYTVVYFVTNPDSNVWKGAVLAGVYILIGMTAVAAGIFLRRFVFTSRTTTGPSLKSQG